MQHSLDQNELEEKRAYEETLRKMQHSLDQNELEEKRAYEETLRKMQHSLVQIELEEKRAYEDCLEAGLTTKDGLPNDKTMLKASCKSYWRYVLIIIQLCRNEGTHSFDFLARFGGSTKWL